METPAHQIGFEVVKKLPARALETTITSSESIYEFTQQHPELSMFVGVVSAGLMILAIVNPMLNKQQKEGR